MGLFGKLFGSGPKGPYRSKNLGAADNAAYGAAQNYLGSNQGPVASGGGNQGYDYGAIDKAAQGFGSAPQLKETYNPTSYQKTDFSNLQNLPESYANEAYGLGSKDIRREGAGQLSQLKGAVGTRRPGLLAKLGQNQARTIGENLASLRGNLDINRINQNNENQFKIASMNQGENQFGANFGANEGYRGYQSRSDLEKGNAGLSKDYLTSLADVGAKKVGLQQQGTQAEREDLARRQQMLQDYLKTIVGSASGTTPGSGGLLGGAAKIASSFI